VDVESDIVESRHWVLLTWFLSRRKAGLGSIFAQPSGGPHHLFIQTGGNPGLARDQNRLPVHKGAPVYGSRRMVPTLYTTVRLCTGMEASQSGHFASVESPAARLLQAAGSPV
jgi:hypothetical protein